jgi:hypothetical protein
MVRDIADGYILASERTFRKYQAREIAEFLQEAERHLREIRSDQPPLSDVEAIQKRQRRMQRMMQAMTIANAQARRRA